MDFLSNFHIKHLQLDKKSKKWLLQVYSVGSNGIRQTCKGGLSKEGRILDKYALVYITRGKGLYYATRNTNNILEVKTGDMIILFPGVWHLYERDPVIGWSEYWTIFSGIYMDKLVEQGFFSPTKPILHLGLDTKLQRLFVQLLDLANTGAIGANLEIAALVEMILARSQALLSSLGKSSRNINLIMKAIAFIEDHVSTSVNFAELAISLNVSYPHLRRIFRQQTGTSMHNSSLYL